MTLPGVLYISAVSDFKGGAEVVLRSMLANPHVRPVLAVPDEGPLGEAATAMGIAVCYYRPTSILNVHRPVRIGPMVAAAADAVRCSRRLVRLAREHGCDILHSNGLKPHMLSALIGATSRTKTLVHLHDIPYRRIERVLWTAIARCVSRVIMVSRPCYPGSVLPANVQVVWNGIAMVCPSLPPARDAGPLRLGFVGRFHPNKGLDLLLDWFGAIRSAGLDATLTIRGRPDPDMPEYWATIEQRIEREGFGEWVKPEGWTVGAATYADIDVLLITSKIPDPAPLVVPEAMSAGVIVAGYPAGGIPDMIEDGRTGFLVRDGADLVRQMRVLLADPAAIERMREAAYAAVKQKFDIGGFHSRLTEIYHDMLTSGASRPSGAPGAVSNAPGRALDAGA